MLQCYQNNAEFLDSEFNFLQNEFEVNTNLFDFGFDQNQKGFIDIDLEILPSFDKVDRENMRIEYIEKYKFIEEEFDETQFDWTSNIEPGKVH